MQKQAARSRPTRRFQFPLGSSHGRDNFSSSGGLSLGVYSLSQNRYRCAGFEPLRAGEGAVVVVHGRGYFV